MNIIKGSPNEKWEDVQAVQHEPFIYFHITTNDQPTIEVLTRAIEANANIQEAVTV